MTNLRDYATVTAAYWAFTLTDGALRMLVLLHFHRLGFTPLDDALRNKNTVGEVSTNQWVARGEVSTNQ